MTTAFDGQYIDKKTGRIYTITSVIKGNGSSVIGGTFITKCGKSVSLIMMEDNSKAMILDDRSILTLVV